MWTWWKLKNWTHRAYDQYGVRWIEECAFLMSHAPSISIDLTVKKAAHGAFSRWINFVRLNVVRTWRWKRWELWDDVRIIEMMKRMFQPSEKKSIYPYDQCKRRTTCPSHEFSTTKCSRNHPIHPIQCRYHAIEIQNTTTTCSSQYS